jgi:hypothetical protein
MRLVKGALTLGLAATLLTVISPGSASAARGGASAARGGGAGGRAVVFVGPQRSGVTVITRRPGQTVIASGTAASAIAGVPIGTFGAPIGTFGAPIGTFGAGVGPGFFGGGYLLDGGYQAGSDRVVLVQPQAPAPVAEQRPPPPPPSPRVEQTPFGVTIYRGSGPSR